MVRTTLQDLYTYYKIIIIYNIIHGLTIVIHHLLYKSYKGQSYSNLQFSIAELFDSICDVWDQLLQMLYVLITLCLNYRSPNCCIPSISCSLVFFEFMPQVFYRVKVRLHHTLQKQNHYRLEVENQCQSFLIQTLHRGWIMGYIHNQFHFYGF